MPQFKMEDTLTCMEFIGHVQGQVDNWITQNWNQTRLINFDLVRFYHLNDEFVMIFNTYGWQSYATNDGDYECYKDGWWSTISLKSDASDLNEKRYGIDQVVAEAYKEYMIRLKGLYWDDEDACLYAK